VVEVNPPKDVEPIRWILLTSLPVTTFEEAWTVIGYYEMRWIVEEYHKALKTGCRTESRQLKTAGRLEAFVGLTSVLAVRLLQLKSIARTNPDTPAKRVVPAAWLKMLKLARKNLNRVHDLTVGQFYREVAKLGGFLGRKSDGEPGWITIWRGWEKLNMYVFVASKLKPTD
jgi:Transposase Tn5 dimerisation domain